MFYIRISTGLLSSAQVCGPASGCRGCLSLVDLLCAAYQDAGLQHKTGVFALEALDTDDARDMLDVQVQRLVSAAVLDDQVQRDTGVGVRAAIKRAVLGG